MSTIDPHNIGLSDAEWACWALLGDPYAHPPVTLQHIYVRIREAISRAKLEAMRTTTAPVSSPADK